MRVDISVALKVRAGLISLIAVLAVVFTAQGAFAQVAVNQGAVTQADAATDALRERIKQRLLEARQQHASKNEREDLSTPGMHQLSVLHGGLLRNYLVYVPKHFTQAEPAAMLLAFHGGGGDMNYMANDEYYGLRSKADSEGFVLVIPNGFSQLKSGMFATWNAGNCCANARDKNIDDVGFVRKIIGNVVEELNIDSGRIYATGMSNGGMMSYRLACEMTDTFAAIAAVAGTDNTITCLPSAPIAILHIHAKNDDRVLYGGGAGEKFRDEAKVTNFVSVPATIDKWVTKNHCATKPVRMLTTDGAYCDSYSQCDGDVAVQLCVTDIGGHSWPGGVKPRGEDPSHAISANNIMWDFFKSVPVKVRAAQ